MSVRYGSCSGLDVSLTCIVTISDGHKILGTYSYPISFRVLAATSFASDLSVPPFVCERAHQLWKRYFPSTKSWERTMSEKFDPVRNFV